PTRTLSLHDALPIWIAAAQIMLDGGLGVLRTMPPASPEAIARFRLEAEALGARWPEDLPYGDFLRTLDREDPRHLAIVHEATSRSEEHTSELQSREK